MSPGALPPRDVPRRWAVHPHPTTGAGRHVPATPQANDAFPALSPPEQPKPIGVQLRVCALRHKRTLREPLTARQPNDRRTPTLPNAPRWANSPEKRPPRQERTAGGPRSPARRDTDRRDIRFARGTAPARVTAPGEIRSPREIRRRWRFHGPYRYGRAAARSERPALPKRDSGPGASGCGSTTHCGLELIDDRLWDTTAFVHLLATRLGPGPDLRTALAT